MSAWRLLQWMIVAFLVGVGGVGRAVEPVPPTFSVAGGMVKAPALVTVTHPNTGGAIFYTIDGPDPRDGFGGVAPEGRALSGPLSVNRSMVVRARVRVGDEWSSLAVAAFTADQDFSKLLFTELMYHPRDRDDHAEFIELKNVGTLPLDLNGLQLVLESTPKSFVFPQKTVIAPESFLVLVRFEVAYRALHPTAQIDGVYSGDMSNSIDTLTIVSAAGAIAAQAHYDTVAPWAVVPDNHGYFPDDGVGFSLVRMSDDPTLDPMEPGSWRTSARRYGSPGADDPPPSILPVYINELLTRGSAGAPDTLELFNPNPTAISVGSWWLSDERNMPFQYQIPAGTIVPAFGYLVLDESQFNGNLSFRAEGERCYLFSADAEGILTGFSHGFQFTGADRDASFGRQLARDGSEDFPLQQARTFGSSNVGAFIPPVVISEVMYSPSAPGDEYIELHNTTDAPFALWDPQVPSSTWAVGTYLFFTTPLPANTTIPARGHLLVVQGNPATFRATYSVPAEVPIISVGSAFSGFKAAREVHLHRPSGLSGGSPVYVVVDHVRYGMHAPWPAGANGSGRSLERIGFTTYGNDPTNWRESPTIRSPGRPNGGNLAPRVSAGGNQIRFAGEIARLTGTLLDDGGDTLTSAWSQVSGPGPVEFTNPGTDSINARFPVTGRYVIRLSASDGSLSAQQEATIDVIERPFNAWRATRFTPEELGEVMVSHPGADPDQDGMSNLSEYFFGTPPKSPNISTLLRTALVNGRWETTWRQINASDIVITPERADRLEGPWFAGPEFFERSERVDGVGLEVTLREKLPAAGRSRGFIRLRLAPR